MPDFPNTSIYEGMRLLAGACGVAVSLWGLLHAADGQMAFPHVIREDMVRDRRIQMAGYLLVHLLLGFQAALVADTPDVYPLSPTALSGNVTLLLSLTILLTVAIRRVGRWASYEEIVGRQPLVPDDYERLVEGARIGRPLIHDVLSQLQLAVGTCDIVAQSHNLTPAQAVELTACVDRLVNAGEQLGRLQILVRELDPATAPHPGEPT